MKTFGKDLIVADSNMENEDNPKNTGERMEGLVNRVHRSVEVERKVDLLLNATDDIKESLNIMHEDMAMMTDCIALMCKRYEYLAKEFNDIKKQTDKIEELSERLEDAIAEHPASSNESGDGSIGY